MLKRASVYQVTLNPQFCTIEDYKTLENLGFNVAWMDDNGDDSYEMVTIWTEESEEFLEDWNLNQLQILVDEYSANLKQEKK